MSARAVVACAAALLLAPAGAQAATVGIEGTAIVYRSAPGEEDLFNAQHTVGDTFVEFEEEEFGTPRVEPAAGCTAYVEGARCPLAGVTAVHVLAGDADDRVGFYGLDLPLVVDLGPGDDDFDGSGLPLTLTAGEGKDRVSVGGPATVDLGPGDDHGQATIGKSFVGPVTLEGGPGRDLLFVDGFRKPGITLSGGDGPDEVIVQLDPGGPGVDVACGPGNDSTKLDLVDRPGDGCAAHVALPDPRTVSRRFRGATLTGPATGTVEFRRHPGASGRGGIPLLARGTFDAPTGGPLAARLKTTKAGKRYIRRDPDLKLFVTIKTRTGGDTSAIDFASRLR